ncbi:MAG: flagellar protein FlbB [Spirochaetales bacterium]|nr:flagellar protein FlbB [Spirochaetales bacterium]
MARYSFVSTGTRILVLILLLIALVIFGLWWFDSMGIIESKNLLNPLFNLVGVRQPAANVDINDPLLLEKENLLKQMEALDLRAEELDKKEQSIVTKQEEIEQISAEIEQQQQNITEQQEAFALKLQEVNDRSKNLILISEKLTGMPPKDAVNIMLGLQDADIIDILRVTEEEASRQGAVSLVSYWLSLMPTERASTLTRLLAR